MKTRIIKAEGYLLLVSDLVEISEKNWTVVGGKVKRVSLFISENGPQITYHLPLKGSPILNGVPLLPPLEQEDDVEKLAEEEYPIIPNTSPNVNWDRANKQEGFERGYNKAKEKYKFTEEDIQKAFTHCAKYAAECISSGVKVDFLGRLEMYLESLSQPKLPTHFEFEMETISKIVNDTWINYESVKTTTNPQGQVITCGKYIYEL